MKKIKKSKKQKVKLDESDYNQALDCSYVLMVAYARTMETCDVLFHDAEVSAVYKKLSEAMVELYQTISKNAPPEKDELEQFFQDLEKGKK